MLSEELRRRIEALNRLPLANPRAQAFGDAPSVQPFPPGKGSITAPHFAIGDGTLARLVAGCECENAAGKHYRVRQTVDAFWPQATRLFCENANGALAARVAHESMHVELAAFAGHFPRSTLFLDLETCGFAGSMVFLIGLVWHDDDVWVLDQLLARDYAEERAILATLWDVVRRNQVLVTFNGKSFDWPMVLDRSTLHRFSCETVSATPGTHCDLLHHARRRWKHRLPNCKLQTLEQAVCKRTRHEDISGADIPIAYHQFVRTGNARELQSIMHHNAMDLVTLIEVTVKLAG